MFISSEVLVYQIEKKYMLVNSETNNVRWCTSTYGLKYPILTINIYKPRKYTNKLSQNKHRTMQAWMHNKYIYPYLAITKLFR